MELRSQTPQGWIDQALSDFDSFLIDHAACERKASATGLMFVVRYPDKHALVEAMIQLSREELMHFHQVWRILKKRNISLGPDERDPYVNALLKFVRNGRREEFLDRLLVFGIVEKRGHERFHLIGQHHPDAEMKDFYSSLAEAEQRHFDIFERMAIKYFPQEEVDERLSELLDLETEILAQLPLRVAVH